MGKSYLVVLLMTLAVASTYWYKSTASTCPVPLSYRIGEIDSSFGVSLEEAQAYAQKAEVLWEEAVNRDLFVYSETAELTIDFIFDERQEEANTEASLSEELEQKRIENEKIMATVDSLQDEYQKLSTGYRSRSAEYETRLSKYNEEVNQYNDRGGAPPDIFKKLADERVSLSRESGELSNIAEKLSTLAVEINKLGDRGNNLVNSYNREVNRYNSYFGYTKEFTQGDYHGSQIRIYKFSSDEELITVLAHEFGHSLGLDHVDGPSSLMYYLLENTNEYPVLSSDDLVGYYEVCGVKETPEQSVRRVVREFLAKF